MKPLVNKSELITIYNSIIQSILDYGAVAYVGCIRNNDKDSLSKMVKRCHSIICNYNCNLNCLENIHLRRLNIARNLFSKIINDNHPILYFSL